MNHKETLSKIKTMLGIQVALESMKLDNGVEVEAEVFETGQEVFIIQEGEKIPLPIGEYGLEDGRVLSVVEAGIIAVINEKPAEEVAEPEAPMAEPEMATSEAAPEVAPQPKKMVESISKELFFTTIDELKAEIAELKLAKVEVKEEVELATEKVVHNPEVEPKKELIKFSQKRPTSTKDIVFNKLFK